MAAAKQSNGSKSNNSKSKPMDAVALLKADHRKVEDLFATYEK